MSQCHKVTLSQIHLVVSSLIRTFAASSSNTVFLWIHVLDLCVLLKIALFVRMDVSVFFHNFTKGLWFIRSACECGAIIFVFFLVFCNIFITFVGIDRTKLKKYLKRVMISHARLYI